MKKLPSVLLYTLILSLVPVLSTFGETGYASWYGGKFQGRQTANGETFDTNKLTAAHKTLPFDTIVEVTNLENGKSVQVRVNDRGPFVDGRIIDLSRAAAVEIGMMGAGIAPVKVHTISTPSDKERDKKINTSSFSPESTHSSEVSHYSIQIASFTTRKNAQQLHSRLNKQGMQPEFEDSGNGHIRVVLPEVHEPDLDPLLTTLSTLGFDSVLVRRH